MKKILFSMFLLVFGLCLAGCQTIVEYASLSTITKDEEFTSAYLSSVNGDAQVLPVDFDDLKEKEFYKNIMNSSAKPTDVLPEVVPSYSLIICSDKNSLQVDDLGNLYATYREKWYLIQCSKDDFNALKDYLFPNNEETYKLTIQNETDYELIGIKEEYKAGEEVEVKMFYEDDVVTYVHLNGENIGYLSGTNSVKFMMPNKDSNLTISYSEEIYRVNVIDNFGLLIIPLKQYYAPSETVQVITKFLSGPSVDVTVDGQFLEVKEAEAFGYYGYEFVMPEKDVDIAILYNGLINQPCEDNAHKWDEGKHQQVPGGGHDELVYTCEYCGHHKYVDFTYEMQIEELATIVENEFKTLNTEKIIIKDLIKMLEDILVEYDLTDTQIKEIEVCVSVLEKLDEFDEITKEELEELYKNPDISDNIE